jgi:hypothetical protein
MTQKPIGVFLTVAILVVIGGLAPPLQEAHATSRRHSCCGGDVRRGQGIVGKFAGKGSVVRLTTPSKAPQDDWPADMILGSFWTYR